ncbi:MAG: carbon-nitrogen hydrolase family protein [Thiohalocapsa sp.]|uniref:carbon-nitrogen hydrolase family protein n=1 Tax=Thiohalocapsa sp. TaxID=2497641 RepID=UPI0025E4F464|nr:carbon-nitrogen hydrolase family protein [Thiohalocapsa sp.]MCG6943006.1 carbon-nitrogen hydrolase family protein [Thiohalocapsa sp.]
MPQHQQHQHDLSDGQPEPPDRQRLSRRTLLQGLLAGIAGLAGGAHRLAGAASERATTSNPTTIKAAAVQMAPKLGNAAANLAQAERLAREAIAAGADWIVLPEMFTSAAAFHPDMLTAIHPIDGAPARLLQDLARQHHLTIGGSFLARAGEDVYNAFLLAMPDGSVRRHDKDFPTYWETCYYVGGDDDGVLETPIGPVGVALCWEMVRAGTAQRLAGKVRLLLAGSTWWTLSDEAPDDHPLRALNRRMLRETPPRMARLLGVPVIHGSHAGPFAGFDSPELPDVSYDSRYLGEAMIVAATGEILARRPAEDGPGIVTAELRIAQAPSPLEPLPDRFWLPEEMPQEWQHAWKRWFPRGEDYYRTVTLPYLATGEVPEYVPPYMR